uniref:SFRICE_027001 n=1 Tax=Spodoptera frugiperda TaxID=7108 RepID=A0A2H1WIM3_SPOFR
MGPSRADARLGAADNVKGYRGSGSKQEKDRALVDTVSAKLFFIWTDACYGWLPYYRYIAYSIFFLSQLHSLSVETPSRPKTLEKKKVATADAYSVPTRRAVGKLIKWAPKAASLRSGGQAA